MDEKNVSDIGSIFMNSEGVCPNCGERVTVLGGLFSAREAGIEDISVCRCPHCHRVFRYELTDGTLNFRDDVTEQFTAPVKPDEEVETEATEAEKPAEEETEIKDQETTEPAEKKPKKTKAEKTIERPAGRGMVQMAVEKHVVQGDGA